MAADGNPAVPVTRPSLVVDGERDATLTAALLTMDIVDSTDGLARCTLWLGNWGSPDGPGFQHFDRRRLDLGKAMAIRIGPDTLFEGRISALKGRYPEGQPPQIGLCLEDRLQDLRMVRRTRCFADATLAEVIEQVAGDHGLRADTDLDGPRHPVLAQLNQSDLAFLRERACDEDVQVWAEGDRLKAASRNARTGRLVELKWSGTLRSFEVGADLAHQRTALVAGGWDRANKEGLVHRADATVVQGELGDGDSGPALLQRAFGERVDTLAHGLPVDAETARALAEAGMRHIARRFVTGRGVAETNAELKVGALLALGGLGPLFDGEYWLTLVHHRFDARGLRTEIGCERAALGRGR